MPGGPATHTAHSPCQDAKNRNAKQRYGQPVTWRSIPCYTSTTLRRVSFARWSNSRLPTHQHAAGWRGTISPRTARRFASSARHGRADSHACDARENYCSTLEPVARATWPSLIWAALSECHWSGRHPFDNTRSITAIMRATAATPSASNAVQPSQLITRS